MARSQIRRISAWLHLFLKIKIYFCRCNFVNKQTKIFKKIFGILEMEPQIYGHLMKMSLYNRKNIAVPFKTKYIVKQRIL